MSIETSKTETDKNKHCKKKKKKTEFIITTGELQM